jgi:hypothetical protein
LEQVLGLEFRYFDRFQGYAAASVSVDVVGCDGLEEVLGLGFRFQGDAAASVSVDVCR